MINYTYNITELTCDLTNPSRPKDVRFVQINLQAQDDINNVSVQRWAAFGLEPGESFVDYDNLTESLVRSWVESHDFWPVVKAEMAEQIDQIVNPARKPLTPPWVVVTTATSTATTSTSVSGAVDTQEIYLRALIYQILDEIKETTV